MNKIIIFNYMFLVSIIVFADDFTFIHSFSLDQELGFKKHFINSGEPYAPRTLTIENDNLYILDIFNNRIVLFSLDGTYLRDFTIISDHSGFYLSPFIKIENDKIILFNGSNGYGIMNLQGGIEFQLPRNLFDRKVYSYRDVYILQDVVIISSKDRWFLYDNQGSLISEDSFIDILIDNYNSISNQSYRDFLQERNILVSDGLVLSGNFSIYSEYSHTSIVRDLNLTSTYLFGIDDDFRHYWNAVSSDYKKYVLITSNDGVVLDYFDVTNASCLYEVFTVSDSGDLYSMRVTEDEISLWKRDRNW